VSKDLVISQGAPMQLPAHLAGVFGDVSATLNDLSGGVQSGFPVISYRGKVWRIRKGGEETNYLDEQGDAVQSLEVVLVKAHAKPSKIFYDKAFEEGVAEAPRCWSANGETPDIGVQDPISTHCAGCPNNVWGSKINEDTGAKGRLCNDARRIAVVSAGEITSKGTGATKCLLRIPPASLNPLKDYADKVLKPKGIPYFAVVTRIGFDPNVAFPKLTFRATRFLNEDEAKAVLEIQTSDDVKNILNESTEFAGAAPAAAEQGEPIHGEMPAAMKAAAATAAPVAQPAPATVTAPAPAATPAAAPPRASSAADAETFPTPPAAAARPRGRPRKSTEAAPVAAAPPPAPAPAASPPAAAEPAPDLATAPSEFDSMLDKLLGA
jgi:hypothetical protein